MADSNAPVDTARYRQVLGHFCSGITIITAVDAEGPIGFACQSFAAVSLDPPTVLFSPQKTSSSWPRIRAAGHFCANILAEDGEEVCRVFATKGADKFAGLGWKPGPSGAPILDAALAYVDCTIARVHDEGDHDLVIGDVVDLHVQHEGAPLLFFRSGYGRFAV